MHADRCLCLQQYHSKDWHEPYRYISCQEMSDSFKAFHVGREVHDQLAQPLSAEYQQQNVCPSLCGTTCHGCPALRPPTLLLAPDSHVLVPLRARGLRCTKPGTSCSGLRACRPASNAPAPHTARHCSVAGP